MPEGLVPSLGGRRGQPFQEGPPRHRQASPVRAQRPRRCTGPEPDRSTGTGSAPAASPAGRTRTAPARHLPGHQLRLALASCQNWEHGLLHRLRHMAERGPRPVVLLLGDYIYEYDAPPTGRPRTPRRPASRRRSTTTATATRSTAATRTCRRRTPRARGSSPGTTTRSRTTTPARSARRRASRRRFAAPPRRRLPGLLRAHAGAAAGRPTGPDMPIYRRFDFGRLARFNVLDTRQYRSDQATSQAGAQDPLAHHARRRAEAVAARRTAPLARPLEPHRLADHDGRDRPPASARASSGTTTPGTATRSNATRCSQEFRAGAATRSCSPATAT